LVPRTRIATKRRRRQPFDPDERSRVALLCRPCHKQIHVLLDEKRLEQEFHALDALAGHPQVAKFLEWIRNKPGDLTVVSYRPSRRRRDRHS
jgi:hypothetical protein